MQKVTKRWEDLEDHIERALLEVNVSKNKSSTTPEKLHYLMSEMKKLTQLRNQATGLEKARAWRRILRVKRIHWDLIIEDKNTPTKQDTRRMEFLNRFTADLQLLKRDYEEATDKAKIGFSHCLIDAFLFYNEVAGEFLQGMPEYQTILHEVITVMDKIKKQSFEFLKNLYEATNGETNVEKSISRIVNDSKLDESLTKDVLYYLLENRLIEQRSSGGNVSITHEGSKAVSQPDKLTHYFSPVNITFIGRDMISSQIQQSSPGATQELVINSDEKEKILKEIEALKGAIEQNSIGQRQRSEIDIQITTIQEQLKSSMPNRRIISEYGKSIRTIIEGALGGIGTQIMLIKAPTLLSIIQHYFS